MTTTASMIELPPSPYDAAHLVQLGMRAAIRDVQDWAEHNAQGGGPEVDGVLDARGLRAYLLALLITAGAYDDLRD